MRQKFHILIIVVLMSLSTSCANSKVISTSVTSASKDSSFTPLIPNCDMSGMVEFTPHSAEFSAGELISLGVGNISKEQLLFPANYNVRIYSYDENAKSWIDIENDVQYISSSGDLLQSSDSGLASYSTLVINPIVVASAPIIVRVVISGNIIKDNQKISDCVGTFTEITIVP